MWLLPTLANLGQCLVPLTGQREIFEVMVLLCSAEGRTPLHVHPQHVAKLSYRLSPKLPMHLGKLSRALLPDTYLSV